MGQSRIGLIAAYRYWRERVLRRQQVQAGAAAGSEQLTRNAMALMANTVAISVLGLVFWIAAARLYSPQVLGQDSGLIAAMILISSLSELSLAQGIPRLLPQLATGRRKAVFSAYLATGFLAVVIATIFVTVTPHMTPGFAFLSTDGTLKIVLVAAVVLWNVFALQDAVLTALRWTWVVPVENIVMATGKIILLVIFASRGTGHGILLAWLLAMIVVLPPVNWLLFARLLKAPRETISNTTSRVPWSDRRRVARYLALDHAGSLLAQANTMILPILVLATLGNPASAYFYVAFTIAGATYTLALALSTSLVVEGAHNELALSWLARRALSRYATLLLPGIVILVAASPLLLRPFGSDYVEHGTALLRLMLIGSAAQALVTVYLGVERVRGRTSRVLTVQVLASLVILGGLAIFVPGHGLLWVGVVWLVGWMVVATAIVPLLYSAIRSEPSA